MNPLHDGATVAAVDKLRAERDALAKDKARLVESLKRAVVLMTATRDFIDKNPVHDYEVFYDGTDCDGYCLREDCQIAIDDADAAMEAHRGL